MVGVIELKGKCKDCPFGELSITTYRSEDMTGKASAMYWVICEHENACERIESFIIPKKRGNTNDSY